MRNHSEALKTTRIQERGKSILILLYRAVCGKKSYESATSLKAKTNQLGSSLVAMLALNISGLEQILSTFAILNMKVDV
jgi:hypothetical protein